MPIETPSRLRVVAWSWPPMWASVAGISTPTSVRAKRMPCSAGAGQEPQADGLARVEPDARAPDLASQCSSVDHADRLSPGPRGRKSARSLAARGCRLRAATRRPCFSMTYGAPRRRAPVAAATTRRAPAVARPATVSSGGAVRREQRPQVARGVALAGPGDLLRGARGHDPPALARRPPGRGRRPSRPTSRRRGCARSRRRCCRRPRGGPARRAAAARRRSGARSWARRGGRACGPVSRRPSSRASRTRCASPPESVDALWPSRR